MPESTQHTADQVSASWCERCGVTGPCYRLGQGRADYSSCLRAAGVSLPKGRGPWLTPRPLPGRRDSSGIRLYYTATLRRFDAGIMELGLVYTPVMAIPPQEAAFVLTGYCTDKCTQLVSAGLARGVPARGLPFQGLRPGDRPPRGPEAPGPQAAQEELAVPTRASLSRTAQPPGFLTGAGGC